jgi:predicted RNase H-like nuclease
VNAHDTTVVGVDACPLGWVATVIEDGTVRTETHGTFDAVDEAHADADRVVVDMPIGLPDDGRRRCDERARDRLGCRGVSVFDPPCRSAAERTDYRDASDEHRERVGRGLSRQAHNIAPKILEVGNVVGDRYDGRVRESHPELCFAALNGQPIAYSKSSDRGRGLRLGLLAAELDGAEAVYRRVCDERLRKEVRRDDILDSMALAVAARNGASTTVPREPDPDEPRIYYPSFEVPGPDAT